MKRDCEVCTLQIYLGHVIPVLRSIDLHEVVQSLEIDDWSLTTISLGSLKQMRVETLGLCGDSPSIVYTVSFGEKFSSFGRFYSSLVGSIEPFLLGAFVAGLCRLGKALCHGNVHLCHLRDVKQ